MIDSISTLGSDVYSSCLKSLIHHKNHSLKLYSFANMTKLEEL